MKHERAALLITSAISLGCILSDLFGRSRPEPDPAAVPRTEEFIARIQEDGWVVLSGEQHGTLLWQVADLEADTSRLAGKVRDLLRAAEIAGAEVRALTEFRAQAEAALRLSGEAHAARPDTLMRLEYPGYAGLHGTPDSITAVFDEGVFSGRVAFFPHPNEFSLLLRARISAAIAITDAPDGRVLFSVVPEDPRVRVTLANAHWAPPPPVQQCSLGTRLRWGISGIGVGVVLPW